MNSNYNNDNRYTFEVEGFDQTAQDRHELTNTRAQEPSAGVDHRYLKKMMTRVIAVSVALALLLGGGLGILLNEFVFSDDGSADRAQVSEGGTDDTVNTDDDPAPSTTPDTNQNSSNLLYTESSNTNEMSISDVVAAVEDSVVAITVEIENTTTYMYSNYSYTSEAKGSGVIISPDGYIVTNNHVIEGATAVYVTLANGESYDATIIGSDDFTDLGLIKIEATGLTAAQFGNSDEIRWYDIAQPDSDRCCG